MLEYSECNDCRNILVTYKDRRKTYSETNDQRNVSVTYEKYKHSRKSADLCVKHLDEFLFLIHHQGVVLLYVLLGELV